MTDAELRARFEALKQDDGGGGNGGNGGGTTGGGDGGTGRAPGEGQGTAAAAAPRAPLDFGHIGDDEIEALLAAAQ